MRSGGTPKAKAALQAAPDADGAKARGASGFGDPVSPGCKLDTSPGASLPRTGKFRPRVTTGPDVQGPWSILLRGAAYATSIPPEEYGRKAENQGNWRAPAQAAEHVA